MQQKKFEDGIMVQEPDEDISDNTEVVVGTAGGDGDEIAGEDSHALLLEDFEFNNVDLEELDDRNDRERAGFFYEEDKDKEQEDSEAGIGARVAARCYGN